MGIKESISELRLKFDADLSEVRDSCAFRISAKKAPSPSF